MVAYPCLILGFAIAPLCRTFFVAMLCAVIVADLFESWFCDCAVHANSMQHRFCAVIVV